ncbi:MAG: hypothetical protein ACFFAS_05670 [Promethearchaeota archaeon]
MESKRYKTFFYDDEDEESEMIIIPTSLVKSLGWSHLGELEVTIETNQAKKLGIFISKPEIRCPRCTHLLEFAPDIEPSGMRCSNPQCQYTKRIYNKITLDKLIKPK